MYSLKSTGERNNAIDILKILSMVSNGGSVTFTTIWYL